jgi:peptide/nickel transport system substrate-binding protein
MRLKRIEPRWKSLGFIALVLVVATLSACGGTKSSGTAADKTVTILVPTLNVSQFQPYLMGGEAPYPAAVFATLVEADDDGKIVPGIAKSWEVSPDGLTWTFHIRDDVKFQDGEALTADDVAFSLNDTYGPEAIKTSTTGAIVQLAENTKSITAPDKTTVVVEHTVPVPGFANIMSPLDANFGGAIFPKKYFEKVGPDGFNEKPIGAGPFKVNEVVPGQSITMTRFDDYYLKDRKPKFKSLVWKVVPEAATRVQALRAGEADIISTDVSQKSQIEQSGGKVVFSPEAAYVRFSLAGCWDKQFACSDVRVRQALDFAVDKESIMANLYGDAWQNVGWAFVSPNSLGYGKDLDPRPFDPDQAKSLLAEAGFPDGKGFPTLDIYTSSDPAVPHLPELAQLIGQAWSKELGIKTKVQVKEQNSLRVDFGARKLDGGVYINSNQARYDGASIILSGYGDPESGTRNHQDPALFKAAQDSALVFDPKERATTFHALYQRLREQSYELGLGSLKLAWGLGPDIKGWKPWALVSRPTAFWTIDVGS